VVLLVLTIKTDKEEHIKCVKSAIQMLKEMAEK